MERTGGSHKNTVLISLIVVVTFGLITIGAFLLGRANKSDSGQAAKQTPIRSAPAKSTGTVSLSVVECPSQYGAGSQPGRYPATMTASLPNKAAAQLEYFSDLARFVQPVLGPRGWSCSVLVGADGSTNLYVYPPGEPNPASTTIGTYPAATEFVDAYSPGGCQGCTDGLVCGLFPSANQALGYSGQPCTATEPPSEEQDRFISGSAAQDFGTVGFIDPAGVKGTGVGSGGTYAAAGTMEFGATNGSPVASAAILTCLLSPSQAVICRTINKEFVSQNWGFDSPPSGPPPTTTTATPVVSNTTTSMVSTTTQPTPEGSVRFVDAQPQTFGFNSLCNDVSFGIDNESNTTVDSATVMFTLNRYSADGSYLGPGPTQGPYGMTVYLLPYAQRQVSVQACPPVSMLLGQGEYFQVTGVSGTYTWASGAG